MAFSFDISEYPIFGAGENQTWNHTWFPEDEVLNNILDIGGHDASFAKACVNRWPSSTVYSVEPNPFLHYHYNDLKNIKLIDGALSYYKEKNFLNIRGMIEKESELVHNFYESDMSYAPRVDSFIELDTTHYTLPELLNLDEFDAVKINCCGSENDFLYNHRDLELLSDVKYVFGVCWGGVIRNAEIALKEYCEFKFTNLLHKYLSDTHHITSYVKEDTGHRSLGFFYCRKK